MGIFLEQLVAHLRRFRDPNPVSFMQIDVFLFLSLMDLDPHESESICGKYVVAESTSLGSVVSYFMKPPPPSKVVKVMLITGYTRDGVFITNLG